MKSKSQRLVRRNHGILQVDAFAAIIVSLELRPEDGEQIPLKAGKVHFEIHAKSIAAPWDCGQASTSGHGHALPFNHKGNCNSGYRNRRIFSRCDAAKHEQEPPRANLHV